MTFEPEAEKPAGRVHHLPELLAEIAEVAGLSAALAVAQVKGGSRAHFPTSCRDDHWLVGAVGREAADKICKNFAVYGSNRESGTGMTASVPLGPTSLYARARFRALAMLEAGHSAPATAREIGVSTRSIENWVAAERKRKAVRRQGKARRADPSTVVLSRPYDRLRDGRMASLDETAPDRARAALPERGENEPDPPAVDLASLSSVTAEMAEVVGVCAALVIATLKGSKVLHVTDHAGRGDEVIRLIGPVSGRKLIAHYRARHGGDIELLIPQAQPKLFAEVLSWVAAVRADGHALSDIAAWAGVTPAIVEHLCRMERATVGTSHSLRRDFPFFDPTAEG